MIDTSLITVARDRLRNIAQFTPFAKAPILSSQVDANIYLKKENLQTTGSFKLRGAYNKIASLTNEERAKGVIAASAGNHAQGVAYSANHYKIDAIIVMPEATPLTKISGVKGFGAEVVLYGKNYDEAYAKAIEIAKAKDITFIHPFEDSEVMAGQATVAMEMLEVNSDLDIVVVPVGGGGLIAGVASYIKRVNPNIKVIGVTSKGAPSMRNSYNAKEVILYGKNVKTIADGIAVKETSPITYKHIIRDVDEIVEVSEEEIASAILFLLERQKLLVEGAGAVGVASVMHNKIADIKGKNVGIVVSGGNIDVTMLSLIIEKGLIKTSRKMKLEVVLVDKPGSLQNLTEILKSCNANIVQIGYDKTSLQVAYGDAIVTIAIETRGEEDQEKIKEELEKEGYKFCVKE
jgi:threonine dehydratase